MTMRRRLAATVMTALLLIPPTSSSATSTGTARRRHDNDRHRRRRRRPKQHRQSSDTAPREQQHRRKTIDGIGFEQARQVDMDDPNDLFLFLTTEAPPPPSDVVVATTTAATLANGDVIVNPGGTCGAGKGNRGNGVCANGKCCSKHGWCGTTPAHCDGLTFEPTSAPSESPVISAPPTTPPPTTKAPTTKAPTTPPDPTASPTTSPPTTPPTIRLFSTHKKFCGPKVVGGFQKAVETCSVATECGKGEDGMGNTAYGSTGNDCPKNFMCFGDIDCLEPTYAPSVAPSAVPSTTFPPSEKGQTRPPTSEPTESNAPTEYPTRKPTEYPTERPTVPPYNLVNSITTRGSFCGVTFEEAVSGCSPTRACNDDDDCDNDVCFPNISCTYHASEASDENYLLTTSGGDGLIQQEGVEEEGDDVYESEFDTDDARFGEEYIPDDISGTEVRRMSDMRAVIAVAFLGVLLMT